MKRSYSRPRRFASNGLTAQIERRVRDMQKELEDMRANVGDYLEEVEPGSDIAENLNALGEALDSAYDAADWVLSLGR